MKERIYNLESTAKRTFNETMAVIDRFDTELGLGYLRIMAKSLEIDPKRTLELYNKLTYALWQELRDREVSKGDEIHVLLFATKWLFLHAHNALTTVKK